MDTSTAKPRLSIDPHYYDLWSIDWTSDGRWIATGSFDQHVKILDARSGELRHDLLHPSGVVDVRFSPNDRYLACATTGQQIYVWDVKSGARIEELVGHRHWETSVDWHPDGKALYSCSVDGTVRRWPVLQTRDEELPYDHFDFDRGLAIASQADGQLELHDLHTQEKLHSWPGEDCQWLASKTRLAIRNDSEVGVVDIPNGTTLNSFSVPEDHKLAAGLSGGDGLLLSTNPEKDVVQAWDESTGTSTGRIDVEPISWIQGSPRSDLFALVREQEVEIVSADPFVSLVKIHDEQMEEGFKILMWSPNGERVATAGWNGKIHIWEARSGRRLHTLTGHVPNQFIRSVDWSRDGRLLASGGWDQSVKVWDAVDGTETFSFDGHSSNIRDIAFDPSGDRLASSDWSGIVKLWDLINGQELMTLENRDGIRDKYLTWSDDGDKLWRTSHHEDWEGFHTPRCYDGRRHPDQVKWCLAKFWQETAKQLAQSGRFQESDEAIREAEGLTGPDVAMRRSRARVMLQRDDTKRAVADLEVASHDSRSPGTKNELAVILASRNDDQPRDLPRAEQLALELVREWPSVRQFWITLALAQYRQQKWPEAQASLKQALEVDSGAAPLAHLLLSMTYWRLGKTDKARQSYDLAEEQWDLATYHYLVWPNKVFPPGSLETLKEEASQLLGLNDSDARASELAQ